jgi:hypothetical protein
MGTRADFYVGTGPTAEWIGSISYDGYPEGAPADVIKATTEVRFRREVERLLADPQILSTRPSEGWPWPWTDSRTTDYAYAFRDGEVVLSAFGDEWETRPHYEARSACDVESRRLRDDEVRDMSALKASTATIMGKSGMLFVRGGS